MIQPMHLLVAEDDRRLARLLVRGFEGEGHEVDVAYDGDEALELALQPKFDALVLDIMMPGMDGLEVVRSLRGRNMSTPVLLLTAKDSIEDRVLGLDSGADDYLVKPFAFDELLARVRAITRRDADVRDATLVSGNLEVDLFRHEVRTPDGTIELTPTEFRMLEFLARHPGQALSRQRILSYVWGYEDEPDANAVDLYVHYLRRKLGDALPLTTLRGL
jgi:DNA-binding response OmpR family regulator